jgi:AraC-like DNA-binding protein
MVCDRCLASVQAILLQQKLAYNSISLGRIELVNEIPEDALYVLVKSLHSAGFELVSERTEQIVNSIKAIVIEQVYERGEADSRKLSEILSDRLHYDYSHLTGIFSRAEGHSIQSFQNKIRIERIKEFLEYGELGMNEIADRLGFSSAAYLSTFFKKETGMNPSQFKSSSSGRQSLDKI